jgi:hypothetical protein
MTFWNLLAAFGFSIAVATLVSAILSADVQSSLFNSTPGNLGRDCTTFIDNTIFRFCGHTLLAWKPLIVSLSLFAIFSGIFILLGVWHSTDPRTFLGYFVEPFIPFSPRTILLALICVTIIILSDYIPFVQTFLLMRYAARTFSFVQIAFPAYTDIMLTISSLIFVGSTLLAVLYSNAIYQPFGFATIISPHLFSEDEAKPFAPKGVEPDGAFSQILFLVNNGKELDESEVTTGLELTNPVIKERSRYLRSSVICRNFIRPDTNNTSVLYTFMTSTPWVYSAFHSEI